MVTVIMNGKAEVRGVKIDPKLLNSEEAELLDIKTPDPAVWSIDIQPYSN